MTPKEINDCPKRVRDYIHDLEEARNCLEFLLTLKDQKDKSGKTDYYLAQMPNAWAWARRLLGPFYRGYKKP